MKQTYSFTETLEYLKEIAPKYEFRKPLRLDSYWSEIIPVQSGSLKLGIFGQFLCNVQDHFGIKLEHRKDLQITTVRDLVLAVHKLSHNKTK